MKNIVLIMLALFTLNGMAQEIKTKSGEKKVQVKEQKSPADIAGAEAKKMTKYLELSSEQQKKVYDVLLEKAEANQASRAERMKMKTSKEQLSKEDYKKVKMKVLDQQKKTDEQMKEILTEEQYTKYEEMNGKKPRTVSGEVKKKN